MLRMFGPEFSAGYDALLILTLGNVAVATFGPATPLLAMTGHQDSAALVHVLSMLGSLALNAALIPLFGIAGAAAATATNLLFMQFALTRIARRDLRVSPSILGGGSGS